MSDTNIISIITDSANNAMNATGRVAEAGGFFINDGNSVAMVGAIPIFRHPLAVITYESRSKLTNDTTLLGALPVWELLRTQASAVSAIRNLIEGEESHTIDNWREVFAVYAPYSAGHLLNAAQNPASWRIVFAGEISEAMQADTKTIHQLHLCRAWHLHASPLSLWSESPENTMKKFAAGMIQRQSMEWRSFHSGNHAGIARKFLWRDKSSNQLKTLYEIIEWSPSGGLHYITEYPPTLMKKDLR